MLVGAVHEAEPVLAALCDSRVEIADVLAMPNADGWKAALSPIERPRVSELEEENRRLRMENEFLKEAANTARPRSPGSAQTTGSGPVSGEPACAGTTPPPRASSPR
jgi:hypothetical protein